MVNSFGWFFHVSMTPRYTMILNTQRRNLALRLGLHTHTHTHTHLDIDILGLGLGLGLETI